MLKVAILLSVLVTTALGEGCPSGWTKFRNSCYFGFLRPLYKFEEAERICEGAHSTLIVVDDALENLFLEGYTQKKFNIWIGATDKLHEGVFVTLDGSRLRYTNWYSGQPNNGGGNEDCVHMYGDRDGKWNDTECYKRFGFICERPARD